jgi:GNAT superfamily N-acetyltransferase
VGRTTVDVRHAGRADVETLLDLAAAARSESVQDSRTEVHGQRARILRLLDRPDVEVLVAEAGHEPVGVLVLRRGELLPLSGGDAVHVEQLYVRQQWRRRGAARALLMAAASLGEQAGLEKLACAVPPADRETARFLARLGFAPLVTQRVVPVATLLRRLAGESPSVRRRSAIDQLLAKRRREQGRTAKPASVLRSVSPRTP